MPNRQDVMLAVLAGAGENASFTPVQVQKLFFLIDRETASLLGGPFFSFTPYDYGPFDKTVYEELDDLQKQGLARIDISGRYRHYALTSLGYEKGQQTLSSFALQMKTFVANAAKWIRSLNFQELVAAIYKRYPDMKANSIFQP